MARRNLEQAIQAGKCIEQGKPLPGTFGHLEIIKDVPIENELEGVWAVQYSFDGDTLAVGFGQGAIRLYDSKTGGMIKELRKTRHGGVPVMCLRYHPKFPNMLIATTADGKILMCNTENLEDDTITESDRIKEKVTEKGNEINCLDFDCDGMCFATAGRDKCVRIYDSSTFQLQTEYGRTDFSQDPGRITGNSLKVNSLRYKPDVYYILFTGGWDTGIKIWDTRNNDGVVRTISGDKIDGDSIDVTNHTILAGTHASKNALVEYDYTSGRPRYIPFQHGIEGAKLYCAQYCDHNIVMAGGAGTRSAQAINKETGQMIGEVKTDKIVQALDTTFGGRLFAIGAGTRYEPDGRKIGGKDLDCLILGRLC